MEGIDQIAQRVEALLSSDSALEALANKVPVIATNIKGNNDIIIHERTGLLVDSRNYISLANAICFAINNPHKMDAFALNGYNIVRSNFTTKKMISSYKETYISSITKFKLHY